MLLVFYKWQCLIEELKDQKSLAGEKISCKCHIVEVLKSMYLDIKINCATVILQPEIPSQLQVPRQLSNRST